MLTVAVSFTNFGPYHLARLRALADQLARSGGRLIAYETASNQALYPWTTRRDQEPFEWITLFPDRVLEEIPAGPCRQEMRKALDLDRPDVVGVVGYYRPESMSMLGWARTNGRPSVLMSESQEVDHRRVWWREAIKRRRVGKFSAGFVGGPSHLDYLVTLGMPAERITLGYNAVDGEKFAAEAEACRRDHDSRAGMPEAPYFLSVCRFAPEKNLVRLIRAYARYRDEDRGVRPWDLVLCGDGPSAEEVGRAIESSGYAASIHRPGFLQADGLARWYAFASAFVLPSLSEPWGLVVNEAASCGLPLVVSTRAGCVGTFVPDAASTTGFRVEPDDVESMASTLHAMASLPASERLVMGRQASAIAREWGPGRFAEGAVEAIEMAILAERCRTAPARPRPVAG